VIVPTFDRADTIVPTLRSLAVQTHRDLEIVVADDGSTDGTAERVAALGIETVVYDWAPNAGPSAARNRGARLARGRYVAFVDTGDVVRPDWLERVDRALDGAAFASWGAVLAVGDRPTGLSLPRVNHPALGRLRAVCGPGQIMVDRRLFLEVGGFDERLRYSEFTELWWRLAPALAGCRVVALDEPLLVRTMPAARGVGPGSLAYSDERRLESARYLLDTHEALFRRRPALRQGYLRIAAVAAARLGDAATARRLFLQAFGVRHDPRELARAAAVSVPPARRRLWPSRGPVCGVPASGRDTSGTAVRSGAPAPEDGGS
jgi:hypothetical protein